MSAPPLATSSELPSQITIERNHVKIISTRSGRVVALTGIAAIAASASLLAGGAAIGAPGDNGSGTLTVHKHEQPASPLGQNDGSELDTTKAKPLVAGFTVCSINEIDLAKSGDWTRIQNIAITPTSSGVPTLTEGGNALSVACGAEQMTSASDGVATFRLPADRAYLVFESTKAQNATSAAQPAIVTVPYPGNGASGQASWNYNPHIYPKNVVSGSGATNQDSVVGDDVTFDISVPIRPLPNGDFYTEFSITDPLNPSLDFESVVPALTTADGASVPLTSDDYTVVETGSGPGSVVKVVFTDSGLKKINDNVGGTVGVQIGATAAATGTTANEATVSINGVGTEPGTGPAVTSPKSFFAGVHIEKTAKLKDATIPVPLANAAFDVYTAPANSTSCSAQPDSSAVRVLDNQASGSDGKTPGRVLASGVYCVYETAVPAGYKGLVGGMLFKVDGASDYVTVLNTQIGADAGDLPALPLTGSVGGLALLGFGGALFGGGLVVLAVRHRVQRKTSGVSRV